MNARRLFTAPARRAAIAPYIWMVLFFLVPFGFVLKISLSQTAIAQPPYLPVFGMTGWGEAFAALSLDNFRLLLSDNLYVGSYLRSLGVALVSTALLLLVGYLGGLSVYRITLDHGATLRAALANTARLDVDAYGVGQRVVAWFSPDDGVVLPR